MPKYVLNSFLAGIFSVTFSASPYSVAADKTSNRLSNQDPIAVVKGRLKELKLETTKSYPEMFARMLAAHPKADSAVFTQLARTLKNEKFPKSQIQEFKYKGKDAIKIINQVGKDQVVVEYLFNGDEVLKINGVVFSKADTDTEDAFTKRLRTIPAYARAYREFRNKTLKASIKQPTYEQWMKLTTAQKAEYHARFRQLLEAAYRVHNTPTFKVVSNSNKSFEQWVNEAMMGAEAYAAGPQPAADAPGSTAVARGQQEVQQAVQKAKNLKDVIGFKKENFFLGKDEKSTNGKLGPSCIVAGYAMEWKGRTCPWNAGSGKDGKDFYAKHPMSQECATPSGPKAKDGGPGWIACNPIIYGFSSSRRPHCINTKDSDNTVRNGYVTSFQSATHGNGPCEKASPLNTPDDKRNFIANILNRGDIPGVDTLRVRKKLGCKPDDNNCGKELITTDKNLFHQILKELSEPLIEYIDSASKICQKETNGDWTYKKDMKPQPPAGANDDPAYQDKACDGLMKRALAVKNLLDPNDTTPAPLADEPCKNWTGETEVVYAPGEGNFCMCKDRRIKPDIAGKKCIAMVPVATPETAPPSDPQEEPTSIGPKPEKVTVEKDCSSIWTRMAPGSGCDSTMGDWVKIIAGGLVAVCAVEAIGKTEIFGMCYNKPKSLTPPVYVDPVCPTAGCGNPVTPDPKPEEPVIPRTEESTTTQESPSINPILVPPR